MHTTDGLRRQLLPADDTAYWPQFCGPNRDNRSTETGLLKKWPEGGPNPLWSARGIGEGFSTVAIADGLIYTTGNIAGSTVITALAKTGKRLWGLNILQQFGSKNITWGLAESLLIDGEHVICCPGGPQTAVVALDKSSGRTVWKSPSAGDLAGYSSPSLAEHDGLRMILVLTYADGMLYTLSERRVMGLVKATPDGHEVVGRFRIPSGGEGPSWPWPVVCGGRLYVRYSDFLYAYDVKR